MTPAPARNKVLKSLYLDPHAASQLDELAKETRIPQAVLLREAVDDMLYRYGKSAVPVTFDVVRKALAKARTILMVHRRNIVELKRGIIPLQNVDDALGWIDIAKSKIEPPRGKVTK